MDLPITLCLKDKTEIAGSVFRFISEKQLIFIRIGKDLGEFVSEATVIIDNTAILKELAKRFEDLQFSTVNKFNQPLADAVLSNQSLALQDTPPTLVAADRLNTDQKAAAEGALQNSFFYLWGPPGTGKTFTLTSVIASLCAAQKRSLICSTTHRAVDQVLLKICQMASKENNEMLASGKVLRIGKIEHPDLLKYADFISVEGVVKRLSQALIDESSQLMTKQQAFKLEKEKMEVISQVFFEIDRLETTQRSVINALNSAESKRMQLRDQVQDCENKLGVIAAQWVRYKLAGAMGRIFLEKPEKLAEKRRTYQNKILDLRQKILEIENTIQAQKIELKNFSESEQALREKTSGYLFPQVVEDLEILDKNLDKISQRLSELQKQLNVMKENILKKALVIGTTLAKLTFKPRGLTDFDTVMIDEASMALLPHLYYTAGLAQSRVVISGDFRQLSPIFESKNPTLEPLIGYDIFKVAGISHGISAKKVVKRLQMLRTQHRMDSAIYDLISGPMYHHALVTGERIAADKQPPDWLNQPITIIDTCNLRPMSTSDAHGSKFNILHALVVRQLAVHLCDHDYTTIWYLYQLYGTSTFYYKDVTNA